MKIKLYGSTNVLFLHPSDGSKCFGGKPLPYVGYNTFGNIYELLTEEQRSLLSVNGWFEKTITDNTITLYVIEKFLPKKFRVEIKNQRFMYEDLLDYLRSTL